MIFMYDPIIHPYSKFGLSLLILKVQKATMSSSGACVDAGGSWLGFGILILIRIWSLVFDTPRFWILALSWFWKWKEHPCPLSPEVFGGYLRFLTGVWHLDLDLDMVTGLWYTNNPNVGSLSWFCRGKKHQCPLSPNLGIWRSLEVPDWGWGCWSWSIFWLCFLILKVQWTSMSFKSSFGALEDAEGSWLGFGILVLIWIWSLVFETTMIQIMTLYLDFEGANNIHVILVLTRALDNAGSSWLKFSILMMIYIWSLVFDTTLLQKAQPS